MSPISKLRSGGRRLLQSYATAPIKKMLWKEFASGRWDHLQHTAGDTYSRTSSHWAYGGDILDLGCGFGNTDNELDYSAYRSYLGVDISDVASPTSSRCCAAIGRTSATAASLLFVSMEDTASDPRRVQRDRRVRTFDRERPRRRLQVRDALGRSSDEDRCSAVGPEGEPLFVCSRPR